MTAFAGSGIQTFSITALVSGYGVALQVATLGLTGYLVGSAGGMVLGGFLADRTRQHHRVAMSGIATAGTLMLLMSAIADHALAVVPVMMLGGIANGITAPSRDVLIRRAAAGAGMGSVFGFVYSGFDLGSSTAPLLFGALLDHQAPHAVFVAIACAFALAVPTVMEVQHRAAARPHVPAGAADYGDASAGKGQHRLSRSALFAPVRRNRGGDALFSMQPSRKLGQGRPSVSQTLIGGRPVENPRSIPCLPEPCPNRRSPARRVCGRWSDRAPCVAPPA